MNDKTTPSFEWRVMKIMFEYIKNKLKQTGIGFLIASFFCVLCCSHDVCAATIKSMRIGHGTGGFRLVLDADSKFDYKAFLLNEPRRLVVDVYDSQVASLVEKSLLHL